MSHILNKIKSIMFGNGFYIQMDPFEQNFFRYPFYYHGFCSSTKAFDLNHIVQDEDLGRQLLTYSFYISHLKSNPKEKLKRSIENLAESDITDFSLKVISLCKVFCVFRNVDKKLRTTNKTSSYFRKKVSHKKISKRFKKLRWADEIEKPLAI